MINVLLSQKLGCIQFEHDFSSESCDRYKSVLRAHTPRTTFNGARPAPEASTGLCDWLRPLRKRLQKCKTCCWLLLGRRWCHAAPRGTAECGSGCVRAQSSCRQEDAHVRSGAHGKEFNKERERSKGQRGAAGWRKDAVKPRSARGARGSERTGALKARFCMGVTSRAFFFFIGLIQLAGVLLWSLLSFPFADLKTSVFIDSTTEAVWSAHRATLTFVWLISSMGAYIKCFWDI